MVFAGIIIVVVLAAGLAYLCSSQSEGFPFVGMAIPACCNGYLAKDNKVSECIKPYPYHYLWGNEVYCCQCPVKYYKILRNGKIEQAPGH